MNVPIQIVSAQIAGIFRGRCVKEIVLGKMRRVRYDEIPTFGGRDVSKIVRAIDRNAVRKSVGLDRTAADGHSFGINVRKAQTLAQAVCQQGEADKARTGAPLEDAGLFGHSAALQKGDEPMSDSSATPIQVVPIINSDRGDGARPIRDDWPEQWIDIAAPKTLKLIHCEAILALAAYKKSANVNIIRLYADPAGESHFVIWNWPLKQFAPPAASVSHFRTQAAKAFLLLDGLHMSALGQKQTNRPERKSVVVRYCPKADIHCG
jgi:hypothetical protein